MTKNQLLEMVRRIIREEKYGADSYSDSMSNLTKEEEIAWKKMQGRDYDELVDFINKKLGRSPSKNWYIGQQFWEFDIDTQQEIYQFLKLKKYL